MKTGPPEQLVGVESMEQQAAEAVQPRKTPLHDPAVGAQTGAVQGAAASDRWHDAAGTDLVAVDVVVVASVSEQRVRSAAGPADPAADRRDRLEQRQKLTRAGAATTVSASFSRRRWNEGSGVSTLRSSHSRTRAPAPSVRPPIATDLTRQYSSCRIVIFMSGMRLAAGSGWCVIVPGDGGASRTRQTGGPCRGRAGRRAR